MAPSGPERVPPAVGTGPPTPLGLASFRAGPGAHSSFLGRFLLSIEAEGAECTAGLAPGRGAVPAPAVAPATLPGSGGAAGKTEATLDCAPGGLPGSPAPQTPQQLPILYCGCQLLREGSVFQKGRVLQARFTHVSLAAAESSPCVLPGHHLGRQRGAEGQVPAQAGVRGARGRLLPDGAGQVSPARHSRLQGPGALTEAGRLLLPSLKTSRESGPQLFSPIHFMLSYLYLPSLSW